jgi:hypothetical protein
MCLPFQSQLNPLSLLRRPLRMELSIEDLSVHGV